MGHAPVNIPCTKDQYEVAGWGPPKTPIDDLIKGDWKSH